MPGSGSEDLSRQDREIIKENYADIKTEEAGISRFFCFYANPENNIPDCLVFTNP